MSRQDLTYVVSKILLKS